MDPIVSSFLLLILSLVAVKALLKRLNGKSADNGAVSSVFGSTLDSFYAVEPLKDFDFNTTPPIEYKPYRTQGHVTMGIQKQTRSNWIRIDSGYLKRLEERRGLVESKPELTIGTGKIVDPAIEELYEEIMIKYLPQRFPTMFKIRGNLVDNLATGSSYPFTTAGLTPADMLRYLSANVEEDFYFMCPDPDGQFRLRGYIACFPGGFLSPARVGESVREIHQPVPGYDKKLGASVDRYFSRMEPGQFIGRMNWSLQVDGADLFRTDGNNFYPETDQLVTDEKYNPPLTECYLRVEHQTLTALPKSRAIIFTVRSYMTRLDEVRAKGEGNALADAIESMPQGLGEYKMRQYWGGKVLPWLRGGPGDATVA
ncbi:hypothetical protein BDV38DRAFT_283707 [Aspergillus pseudotamarii]|uniref:Uncharacterized protein n=1 Tax=Aspergillus pseudotamarii TaxID=132259 RepID=A0A5N6SSF1_ASPPS|nr:uncharacterized protein BDV38DRAFT_283707 [Aspergillus pseudotamarii]KAE8136769.1 hypothetical protein BDV38DRAFT_283707 [Aspergillus pseudotamarii]